MSTEKKKAKNRLYPAKDSCPCESGLPYGECCKQKRFRFEIDQKGRIYKSLKIHPKLKPELEQAIQDFKEVFGRKPAKSDPILFNQHLHTEEDFWQQTQKAGRISGIREELIFAWRRSGFIVGEHSRALMPDSQYEEWEDAIDEYFLWKDEGVDPFHIFTYLNGHEYEQYKSLVQRIDNAIIALGFAFSNSKKPIDSASYFRRTFFNRALRSLRTIREMYNTRYDDDCLAIARSVYETYLRLVLLRISPESSARFEAMLAHEAGLFPNKVRKNGRPDHSTCVNPETGEEFQILISNQEILKISDLPLETALYYDLYPLFSGHVHPELTQDVLRSIRENQSTKNESGDPIRSIILILIVCLLLLMEVSQSKFLPKRTIRDVEYVWKTIYKDLRLFLLSKNLLNRGIAPLSVYAFLGLSVSSQPAHGGENID